MKKYITILLVATLALAACSQIEPETQEGFTLTIYVTKDTEGIATKALSLEGKTLDIRHLSFERPIGVFLVQARDNRSAKRGKSVRA